MTNRKAPGPDCIPGDFCKWLDTEALDIVSAFLNICKQSKTFPKELDKAEVVTIFKKVKGSDPGNYRPITLQQALYRLYGSVIRSRFIDVLVDCILNTIRL